MTLKELREASKLTQEQAAKLAGLHQTQISKLEAGRTPNPGIGTLNALATAYGVNLNIILAALRESVAA